MQILAAGMEKAPVLLCRASSDLLHPRFVWMPGDASYDYAAALQMKEENASRGIASFILVTNTR